MLADGRILEVPLKSLESGHMAIYGPTESGKTRYAKTLITNVLKPHNLIVFLGSIDKSWDCFALPTVLEGVDWVMKCSVYDSFDDNIEKILDDCIAEHAEGHKTVIVFDDFNNKINTQTNTRYIELFTQGRHAGIRVINMSQTGVGIGKASRGNIRYVALLHTSNIEFVRSLSIYLNNNFAKLSEYMDSVAGTRNVVLIDTKNQDVVIDNSENYAPRNGQLVPAAHVQNGGYGEGDIYNRMMGEFGLDPGLRNGGYGDRNGSSNRTGNDTVGNVGSVGTKNVMNNGVYNDNSQINFQNNIEIKKRIELNKAEQNITVANYKFQRRMKMMSEKDELYDMLMKYARTQEEFARCVTLLTQFCKLDKNTILCNFSHYAQKFLDHYYPGAKYTVRSKLVDVVSNNRDVITNPNAGNISDLLLRGAVSVAKNNRGDTGILGKIVRNTPAVYLLEDE